MILLALVAVAHADGPAVGDVDSPVRSGTRSETDAAVVVGLEEYAYVPDVPYARRDAEAFYNFLVYTRGVPAERVHLLTTASASMILREVRVAAEEVGPDGTLWVYYAGHGAASATDGARVLLADDVRPDPVAMEEGAVRLDALLSLATGPNQHTLVVLDTCYSGLGRDGRQLADGTRFAVPSYATAARANTTVWTAAGGNERAAPYEPARHGAFTYFVVGAMRGWADGELTGARDQVVKLDEAQAYVARMLRTVGERAQTPSVSGEDGIVLSRGSNEVGPDLSSATPAWPVPLHAASPTRTGRPYPVRTLSLIHI